MKCEKNLHYSYGCYKLKALTITIHNFSIKSVMCK